MKMKQLTKVRKYAVIILCIIGGAGMFQGERIEHITIGLMLLGTAALVSAIEIAEKEQEDGDLDE